ncbi:hypothetical protein BJF83_10105 [Nocardiopsis sp. CNR-923]|uniref:hypothetical protein n=1 Tax=Nocardiopsis sp. CNR-923 TaxID=1904965 RepID=UPI000959953E|nr:hypothetical protein [Nocardiopsis sp. CNR-923]OLT29730.1 hypothetical protein BJF83_10105 [Nocardiopsis sp. CNR-923]
MSNASLPPGASSPRDHGRDRGRGREAARRPDDRDADRDDRRPAGSGGASSSTMAMILHAITFVCCANWLFGVAGIVFAVRAAHARDRGRAEQAETLTRYSWYCLGAAGVMLFVMTVLTFVMLTRAGSWIQGIVPIANF